jgi:hypothetical protein
MTVLKSIIIFIMTLIIPFLGIVLLSEGLLRLSLSLLLLICLLLVFYYAEKLILLSFGAREIIDADNQVLFQALKGQTYRHREKQPKVYLYTGHRVKCFVFEKFGGWSILLDRSLLRGLSKEQVEALVFYIINYKKSGQAKIQTIGMGKVSNIGIFITLIMIKPLLELIISLSKIRTKVQSPLELKSIFYQIDEEVVKRSFTEFMIYHLEKDVTLQDLLVEFLEEYPMLENCEFEGV